MYLGVAGDAMASVDAGWPGPSRRGALTMRVVIAGGGSVGKFIAEQLHNGGHEVLLIDNDPDVVQRAQADHEPAGVPWFLADACEVSQAGRGRAVDKADVMAAVTGDDEDNLVISLLAKQEFGVPASWPG